jgi:uncharacterized membrane protein YozB (DUF420 family)
MDLSFLPAVNACLNGLATVLLIIGYVQVRRRKIDAHQNTMLVAFVVSCLFLFFYVAHKVWRGGVNTPWNVTGWPQVVYRVMLFSHVVLAAIVPVLAIWLIRLGLKRSDQRHRRLGKIALPIWLYVSVTGVVIYFVLYHFNPAP